MGSPSSPHVVLILASLAEQSRHGYAVKKDISARTNGGVSLGSTTLYRLLGQLLDEKLIEEHWGRSQAESDDPRRRHYGITAAGRRALAAELRHLERVLMGARAGAPRAR